jgi:hypothetical protein
MIPLDSPRWSTLTHAYGAASDTPALLARLREERTCAVGAASAWDEVAVSLCHQYSMYPATYAAFPHLLDIAETGTPHQRFEVLLFAGVCAVHGHAPEDLPKDLEGALEPFLEGVAVGSLATLLDRTYQNAELNYALGAFAGIRFPDDPAARAVEGLYEGNDEVICICPGCEKDIAVWMRDDGPHGLAFDARGHTIEDFTGQRVLDRAGYAARLEQAGALLGEATNPSWPEEQTGEVLAHLAARCGDSRLATRLLDLSAEVRCPCCAAEWAVELAVAP